MYSVLYKWERQGGRESEREGGEGWERERERERERRERGEEEEEEEERKGKMLDNNTCTGITFTVCMWSKNILKLGRHACLDTSPHGRLK